MVCFPFTCIVFDFSVCLLCSLSAFNCERCTATKPSSFTEQLLISVVSSCMFCLIGLNTICEAVAETDVSANEARDALAEEAAAAAVGDAAEAEEDDDADAMDEDADASRLDLNNPDKHPLSNLPPEAKDVEIGHAFSDKLHEDKLVLGQAQRSLIGFANNGKLRYHVWGVMGSLNMPHNFRMYVQNFSYGQVNRSVAAGEELSFEYTFIPNERLDTTDFSLAITVFYEARGSTGNVIRAHSTTFLNQTVHAVAGPQEVNNATFLALLVVALAGIGAGIYFMKGVLDESKRSSTEMGTTSSDGSEWLEDHQNMMRGGGRTKAQSQ